ncbi:hypothetical protein O7M46_05355 [Bisgaard Taxon 45]|uniref:Lipoprotein n=1 Tax=Bisgaard Taxon 45 TaxID=304289 RepID=A0ABT9KE81_9PAST|nr:hypothetical protein [Bisgaard Taxon 45]
MQTYSKLGFLCLLSFGLVACDQITGFNSTSNTADQTKSPAVTLDPKAEFHLFIDFQNKNNAKIATLNQEIAHVTQSGDMANLAPLVNKFSTEINGIVKELDTLPIYSAEVLKLKEKAKILLVMSTEVLNENVTLHHHPSPEGSKALLQKRDILLKITNEFAQMNDELMQKYGPPPQP